MASCSWIQGFRPRKKGMCPSGMNRWILSRKALIAKRSSGEFHCYGEQVLKVEQGKWSHLISSLPCLAARRGREELTREKEYLSSGNRALGFNLGKEKKGPWVIVWDTKPPSGMLIRCLLAVCRELWISSPASLFAADNPIDAIPSLPSLKARSSLFLRVATVHHVSNIHHVKKSFCRLVCWKNEFFRWTYEWVTFVWNVAKDRAL